MKPIDYYKGREQTYLKHFFLERYLETVAYHIGYSQREFVYVDCFAGPWRAEHEELGDTSIRIALHKLNTVREGLAKQNKYPTIRAVFIEKSPAAFSTLQQLLKTHSDQVKAVALPGSFEDNLEKIVAEIGSAFGFIFVDPTGWTGFPMESFRRILRNLKGEVMVNFMFDFVNRFLNDQRVGIEESLDRYFGTEAWREIRDTQDREAAQVELYAEQVRAAGNFHYATYTRILKPLHERAYFHLVYATRSRKGIEKFRDVEKQVVTEQDHVRDRAQREHRESKTGQPEFQFSSERPSNNLQDDRDRQLARAREKILQIVAKQPILYELLQPQILEIPLVWKSDFNKILMSEQQAGSLVIEGLASRARTPKAGCLIRPGKVTS